MVKKEFYKIREDGVNLYRSYSDIGKVIMQVQTGAKYDEAIDVETAPYTYIETEEDVVRSENEETETGVE